MTQDRTDWSDDTATNDLLTPMAGDDLDAGSNEPAEVEVIVAEIEQTQDELGATVQEIGDRLDPANVVRQAKETVRDATVGKVEQMATTASDMVGEAGQTAQQAGAGIVETIRRNPIPAAMAAIGVGWLWMSRTPSRSSWGSSGRWQDQGRWVAYDGGGYGRYAGSGYAGAEVVSGGHDAYRSGGVGVMGERGASGGLGDRASGAVHSVGDAASGAADTIGRRASDAVSTAGDTLRSAPDQMTSFGREASDNLGRVFQENPLAAGAVAIAVGTVIGMAMPSTRTEQRVLGKATSQVIDKAEQAISQPMQQLEQQAQGGSQESPSQG